jgi:three-Cys-motif partner protein
MPRVLAQRFFEEQTAHSRVKASIVYKFVTAWMGVFLGSSRPGSPLSIAYADLFSGPGSYEDGSRSTPLLIVEAARAKRQFADGLKLYFNDTKPEFIQSLEQEINASQGPWNLKTPPAYSSSAASIALIDSFSIPNDVPQFFFLDQFGWADVSPQMIRRIFRAAKCDAAFFVRTNRMVAAVTNERAQAAMSNLLGARRLQELREDFRTAGAKKAELLLAALKDVCSENGAPLFQAFSFRIKEEHSPRHHLIYLGKHPKGLSIMKEIMGRSSSLEEAGVPTMGFAEVPQTMNLFQADPLLDLETQLLGEFASRKLSVGSIYTQHHPGNSLYLKHYQEALRRLEARGAVRATPHAANRPHRHGVVTMSETVTIQFGPFERNS